MTAGSVHNTVASPHALTCVVDGVSVCVCVCVCVYVCVTSE